MQDEIRVLKRMKSEIEDLTKDLQKDCDKCMKEADKERNKDVKIRLLSKATKLRENVLSKGEELKKLENTLGQKELSLKKKYTMNNFMLTLVYSASHKLASLSDN